MLLQKDTRGFGVAHAAIRRYRAVLKVELELIGVVFYQDCLAVEREAILRPALEERKQSVEKRRKPLAGVAARQFLSKAILLIYMFPAIVLVIPLYSVFTQLGLRDTRHGLLIVYSAMTIPVALYMLRSYFQTLPADLEEAGLIDGCSRAQVIWRITIPLSGPAIASVGLYVFMIAWNEFLFAFMFLDTPAIFTLSRGMMVLDDMEVPRQLLMAGATIITIPIMVLFFRFQRYLVGGLTAGSVKG